MNADLKAKWIAALRSGKYKQTVGELRDHTSDAFCCLGVLCDVAGVPRSANDGYYDFAGYGIANSIILGALAEGLPQTELTAMNDSDGSDFTTIADWIETNVKVEGESHAR